MNESWNTMNLSMLRPNGKGKDEVSLNDINNLLKKKSEEPAISDYDENDVKALEKFCNEHGILGVNFGRMNPKAALNMLKGRMGYKEQSVSRKEVLYG